MEQRERDAILRLTCVVESIAETVGNLKKGLLDVHGRLEKLEKKTERSYQGDNQ